jgi:predicted nucleic acid-binding protein
MKPVFVDTSGFFAALVVEDAHHEKARALLHRAEQESWRLITSNVVVFETHALLLYRSRPGRHNALSFLDLLEADAYHIERVRSIDEEHAIQLVRTHEDKAYSLCDALSFVLMERLHITEAIAFDRHFAQYGRLTIL